MRREIEITGKVDGLVKGVHSMKPEDGQPLVDIGVAQWVEAKKPAPAPAVKTKGGK